MALTLFFVAHATSCSLRHELCTRLCQSQNSLRQKMMQREEVGVVSSVNMANLDFATLEKQQARAFLRERFLRVVTGIVGKQAEFYLHENTRVSGEFRGCNVEYSEILVRNLETPIGKVPEAILRGSDVIHLNIDDIDIDN